MELLDALHRVEQAVVVRPDYAEIVTLIDEAEACLPDPDPEDYASLLRHWRFTVALDYGRATSEVEQALTSVLGGEPDMARRLRITGAAYATHVALRPYFDREVALVEGMPPGACHRYAMEFIAGVRRNVSPPESAGPQR